MRNELSNHGGKVRTQQVKKNIYQSILIKFIGIGMSFITVPLTVKYLDIELYGIWMVLLSILSWVNFFDLGLGNGLKNKLAEELSKGDIEQAKSYIATSYLVITGIVILLVSLFNLIMPLIQWDKVFNTHSSNELLGIVMYITGLTTLLHLVLGMYKPLFEAVQWSSIIGWGQLFNSIVTILGIILVSYSKIPVLLGITCVYTMGIITTDLIMTVYFFRKYKSLVPKSRSFDTYKIKSIMGLSIQFFVIQLAAIIIFTTDNMIITQILGPTEVTSYNMVMKLFSIVIMGYNILLTPLWSAYTEAYTKKDYIWIKSVIKKMNLLLLPTIVLIIVMIMSCRKVMDIWIGEQLIYSDLLIITTAIYTLISIWNNIYAYFINGVGKLEVYMWAAVLGAIINIPLSIYFAHLYGNAGVLLASIISLGISSIQMPIATWKILNTRGR